MSIIQIQLMAEDLRLLSAFYMDGSEMLEHAETANAEIAKRAASYGAVKRITYKDDDGDCCTLTTETLPDALTHVSPDPSDDSGTGMLEFCVLFEATQTDRHAVHAAAHAAAMLAATTDHQAPTAAPAEETAEKERELCGAQSVWQAGIMSELGRLAAGSDLDHLVPLLAAAALRVVETAQEPVLFAFIEPLLELQEGRRSAQDIPEMLPPFISAAAALPIPTALQLLVRFREEAEKALAEHQQSTNNVPVHRNVSCDGCNMCPIRGHRFHRIGYDFDLCETCYAKNDEPNGHFEEIQVRPQAAAQEAIKAHEGKCVEVHIASACDGCNTCPIIGARYRSIEREDYDLCEKCHGAHNGAESFERIPGCIADIVDAFYAVPAEAGAAPKHQGITCDGCEMSPLHGSRFRKIGEDFDLCEACYKHTDQPKEQFEEMVVAVSGVVETASPPVDPNAGASGSEATVLPVLSTGVACEALKHFAESAGDDACRELMLMLLGSANPSVHAAAHAALLAAGQRVEFRQEATDSTDDTAEREWQAVEAASVEVQEEAQIEDAQTPEPTVSARVVAAMPLFAGVEALDDEAARGDITEQFPFGDTQFRQAYCVGRLEIQVGGEAMPAVAKAILQNDGSESWPAATVLVHVLGDDFGLKQMHLGEMTPGELAEIILDLEIPAKTECGTIHSGWAIVDAATGQQLGPLILFEASHVSS